MKRRLLSLLLLLTLLITSVPINVLAEGLSRIDSNSNGIKPSNVQAGNEGSASDPGVMISIGTIENTITAEQKEEMIQHNNSVYSSGLGKPYSEMGYSFDDNYLHTYPSFYQSNDISKKSALIVRSDGQRVINNTEYYVNNNNSIAMPFNSVWKVARNWELAAVDQRTWEENINVITNNITENEVYKKIFSRTEGYTSPEQMDQLVAYIKNYYDNLVADDIAMRSVVRNFNKVFSDTYYTSIYLNAINRNSDNEDEVIYARLKYLDVLLIVNYMTGNQSWNAVENYIRNLNEDNADKFTVIWLQSVVCYGGVWYSYPSYHASCTNNNYNYYAEKMDVGSTIGFYSNSVLHNG